MKIILNKCHGGFSVSFEGYQLYAKKKGINIYTYNNVIKNDEDYLIKVKSIQDFYYFPFLSLYYFSIDLGEKIRWEDITGQMWVNSIRLRDLDRADPILVEVVEELGKKANGKYASLKVVEIPDDMEYTITDYDGVETLHEIHKSW